MNEVKVFLPTWEKLVVGRGIPPAGQNHHTFLRGPESGEVCFRLVGWWWGGGGGRRIFSPLTASLSCDPEIRYSSFLFNFMEFLIPFQDFWNDVPSNLRPTSSQMAEVDSRTVFPHKPLLIFQREALTGHSAEFVTDWDQIFFLILCPAAEWEVPQVTSPRCAPTTTISGIFSDRSHWKPLCLSSAVSCSRSKVLFALRESKDKLHWERGSRWVICSSSGASARVNIT